MYLYDISTEYRDLAEKILEQDGEITEEDIYRVDGDTPADDDPDKQN